jgi:hypothetical protein
VNPAHMIIEWKINSLSFPCCSIPEKETGFRQSMIHANRSSDLQIRGIIHVYLPEISIGNKAEISLDIFGISHLNGTE